MAHRQVQELHELVVAGQVDPTELGDNQVSRLHRLRERYPTCELGFADHVPEDEEDRFWLATVAVGAGATVIEKHLTLDRAAPGPDHASSLEPGEFADMVAGMYALHGILLALYSRERTGEGRHIDGAQLEMSLHFLAPEILEYQACGLPATRAAGSGATWEGPRSEAISEGEQGTRRSWV